MMKREESFIFSYRRIHPYSDLNLELVFNLWFLISDRYTNLFPGKLNDNKNISFKFLYTGHTHLGNKKIYHIKISRCHFDVKNGENELSYRNVRAYRIINTMVRQCYNIKNYSLKTFPCCSALTRFWCAYYFDSRKPRNRFCGKNGSSFYWL